MKQILSIDVGTSNVRAMLVDEKGKLQGLCQTPLTTLYPKLDHTEMDPEEIFTGCLAVVDKVLAMTGTLKKDLLGIGISNARETTIVWDKETGKPYWNAILWHDTRSNKFCKEHESKSSMIKDKTGIPLSSYGSATKINWILKNSPNLKQENCLFGNINTWLLWKLTDGKVFKTDITNASRTLLFNIHTGEWDEELLDFFEVKKEMLPEVVSCSETYGRTETKLFNAAIPICAMIGDAQSALFAAGCHKEGALHASIGTGTFLLAHTGEKISKRDFPLLSTVAMQRKGQAPTYCIEASVFSTGSVVEWLKSHIGIIRSAKEIEGLAFSVPDSLGAFCVPLIHGASSIKGGTDLRASFLNLSSATNIGHLCRATLEGIAHMIANAYELIENKKTAITLKCSGGMSENTFLIQMISDLVGSNVVRSKDLELSAFGAAYLAGLSLGVWKDEEEIRSLFKSDRQFTPSITEGNRKEMKKNWNKALSATTFFSN